MKYIVRPRYTHAELVRLAHERGYAYMHKIYHKHGTEIVFTNDPYHRDAQQWIARNKRFIIADEMTKLEAK